MLDNMTVNGPKEQHGRYDRVSRRRPPLRSSLELDAHFARRLMTVSTGLPRTRPLTNDDLELVPDDGRRYELLDGSLLVTPGPVWEHQEVGLDPAARTLVAFELGNGRYEQIVSLAPDGSFDFERPFPVRISMAELCRGLDPD